MPNYHAINSGKHFRQAISALAVFVLASMALLMPAATASAKQQPAQCPWTVDSGPINSNHVGKISADQLYSCIGTGEVSSISVSWEVADPKRPFEPYEVTITSHRHSDSLIAELPSTTVLKELRQFGKDHGVADSFYYQGRKWYPLDCNWYATNSEYGDLAFSRNQYVRHVKLDMQWACILEGQVETVRVKLKRGSASTTMTIVKRDEPGTVISTEFSNDLNLEKLQAASIRHGADLQVFRASRWELVKAFGRVIFPTAVVVPIVCLIFVLIRFINKRSKRKGN